CKEKFREFIFRFVVPSALFVRGSESRINAEVACTPCARIRTAGSVFHWNFSKNQFTWPGPSSSAFALALTAAVKQAALSEARCGTAPAEEDVLSYTQSTVAARPAPSLADRAGHRPAPAGNTTPERLGCFGLPA